MTLIEVVAVLCIIESNGNPNAIGDRHLGEDCARGILQIRPCVITDVNRKYKTAYRVEDCFDAEKSKDICIKYLTMYCGKNASFETYVRTWNGGPTGAKRQTTLAYWHKCQKILSRRIV